MNQLRAIMLVVIYAGFGALSASPAGAQSKAAAARCAALLTPAEVVAIVGKGFQGPAVMEPRPDFTSCEWQGTDANFGFTFTGVRALKTDRQSAEAAFENDVAAVENDQRKREVLSGVGIKAAQVSVGDDAFLIEVQRTDGVARMTFYKIAADKRLALAKALAAPSATATAPARGRGN
jgi:hypothetical protein